MPPNGAKLTEPEIPAGILGRMPRPFNTATGVGRGTSQNRTLSARLSESGAHNNTHHHHRQQALNLALAIRVGNAAGQTTELTAHITPPSGQ